MPPESAIDTLQREVTAWVDETLGDYPQKLRARRPSDEKIIRDAVHGFQRLDGWEVEIIDSPIVQRLRRIHQTSLAHLVYPSANHTRFEHSLGVAHMVTAAARSTHERGIHGSWGSGVFTPDAVADLRIAAILHDTGHAMFSHLSETILSSYFPIFEQIRQDDDELFGGAHPGEILSYLIVRSEPFRSLLGLCEQRHRRSWNLDRIAAMILGKPASNPESASNQQYLADLLNGPFDLDKMDYLVRDAHFTGIKIDVDLERLLYAFTLYNIDSGLRYMAMDSSGVPFLEQLLFDKMMLYTAVYHHHKVRAIEALFKGIFETLMNPVNDDSIVSAQLKFKTPTDLMRIDESTFFTLGQHEPLIKDRINRLLKRDLPKRVLQIASRNVENADALTDLVTLGDHVTEPLRELRQEIFDAITPKLHQTHVEDLWVDLPRGPRLAGEAQRCWIQFGSGKNTEIETLLDIFPVDRWLESYEQNKWRGHVFYTEDEDQRTAANRAARAVLARRYHIAWKSVATWAAKLDE